jgi:dienelactone hydrolase
MVDGFVSRGEGLDASGDPYAPPLSRAESDALLDRVRTARFDPDMRAPIPLPEGGAEMDLLVRPPRTGHRWAVIAPPYGAFARPGSLGVYGAHAAALARRGFGVAAVGLPYPGRRTPETRPSGWGFVRADLAHTARAVAASAAEVVALARWLREERGATRVVGLGMSLGGAAMGLASAMRAPLDRVAFLAAVDSCASFFETGQNREARRRTLRAAGVGPREVEAAFRSMAPSSYSRPDAPALFAIPPEDLVVPAITQRAWRDAWSGATMDLGWRGHAIALADSLVARRVAAWLAT